MNRLGPFAFIVALLAVTGMSLAAYRVTQHHVPLLPGTQEVLWQLEARIEFRGNDGPVVARLSLPPEQSGFRIVNRSSASSGFGYAIEQTDRGQVARWSTRRASGEQVLFFTLELAPDAGETVTPAEPLWQPPPPLEEPYQTAISELTEAALERSGDGYTLAHELSLAFASSDQNAALLISRYGEVQALIHALEQAAVPARSAEVIPLSDGRRRQSATTLVEVWNDGWHLFDPLSGPVSDSSELFVWRNSMPGLLEVEGGRDSRVTFSMVRETRSALSLTNDARSDFAFSLYDLPIAEQSMFKLIMLLPVGALVVVFMRLLVGLRTSGTFMPVLIALAFLQTELLPGILSFLIIVGVGLVIRGLLSELNLLLVARIAALIVVVIGMISVFSLLSYQLGLIGGLTITFFPMIILAWTIERMSIIWEEEGPKEVLVQGGGSLLVAVLAFLVMDLAVVRHLAFTLPELHLVVLAFILVLGRYTGYRLSELTRFASFK